MGNYTHFAGVEDCKICTVYKIMKYTTFEVDSVFFFVHLKKSFSKISLANEMSQDVTEYTVNNQL